MPSPITRNFVQSLASPALTKVSSFPSTPSLQIKQAETTSSRLTGDQALSDQRQERIQRLIQRSMDAELLQKSAQTSGLNKSQAAMVKGLQTEVAAYVITKAQRDLIGSTAEALGYA